MVLSGPVVGNDTHSMLQPSFRRVIKGWELCRVLTGVLIVLRTEQK